MRGPLSILLMSLISSLPCKGQESWVFSLFFENDLFANTDENYTNGTKLSMVSPDLGRFEEQIPDWAAGFAGVLPFVNVAPVEGEVVQKNVGISLGQKIFTPGDIATSDLIEDDRPYAGWLYLGFALHSKTETQLDTVELQLGIVGPASFAETAQKFVHETRKLQRPNGWHHQLGNEPGINWVYEHKRRLFYTDNMGGGLGGDFIGRAGFSLGNVSTYANVGAEARLGWNLPKDFGTPTLRPTGNIMAARRPDQRFAFSFYSFAGVEGRGVLRDIFLDGNTFSDSHSVNRKPWVGDLYAGFSFDIKKIKISYAQVFRTKQFEEQDDEHTYGSITATYFF